MNCKDKANCRSHCGKEINKGKGAGNFYLASPMGKFQKAMGCLIFNQSTLVPVPQRNKNNR
jgi:hypothetical protein